jgi:hypothetical protein
MVVEKRVRLNEHFWSWRLKQPIKKLNPSQNYHLKDPNKKHNFTNVKCALLSDFNRAGMFLSNFSKTPCIKFDVSPFSRSRVISCI